MKKNFMLSRTIIFSLVLLLSCSKESLQKNEDNPNPPVKETITKIKNDQSYQARGSNVSNVISDPNFISYMEIIKEISTINDYVSHDLENDQLQIILERFKNVTTAEEGLKIYADIGIQNSNEIFELFNKLTPLAVKVIRENPAFANLENEANKELFIDCVMAYNEDNPIRHFLYSRDVCSDAYAGGMSDCDDNFTIACAVTTITAAGVLVGSGGGAALASGGIVFSGIGGAYAALYVCQRGVVRAWKLCREEHPI